MTITQQLLMLLPLAYLLGSVPFGLIVGLAKGIDVRKSGSGNIGATNVGRLLGGRYFVLVFVLDLLKGLLPALVASWLVGPHLGTADASLYGLWLAVAFGAILGHMFSVFLKFKGGKGVATSAGVMLGIWPFYTLTAVITVAVFVICVKLSRIVSLSSMAAAISFPIGYVVLGYFLNWTILGPRWPMLAFAIVVAVIIVVKHRTNIQRLIAGTENRVGARKSEGREGDAG